MKTKTLVWTLIIILLALILVIGLASKENSSTSKGKDVGGVTQGDIDNLEADLNALEVEDLGGLSG